MGFFSEDMVPMLGVYEAETSELIASLDAIVSRVEREKEFTHEDIAELFRYAHTIKGSSGMMGLDALSRFTHRVEDLFDLLRSDPTLAEGRVPDILDHLYSFSDYVKDEVGRMEDPDYSPASADALIDEVTKYIALLSGEDSGQGAGPEQNAAPEADSLAQEDTANEDELDSMSKDSGGAVLKIGFKPDVPMVNARALVVVKQLKGQVGVKSTVPENLVNSQAAQAIAENGLLIVVDSADAEKAKHFLAKNSFIRRIDILDEAAPSPAASASNTDANATEATPAADKFVTLRWNNVHDLQNMAGEFLLHISQLKSLSHDMPEESGMRNTVSQTARLVDELVYHVNKMAMVSMSAMIPQLSRMVRDMCRNSGKQVSFEVNGGDIDIDRNLYNSISDPLLHIIRNAVDHGIEPPEERLANGKDARGNVTLSIENLGARVAFRVSDDGKGIDTNKVLAKAEANGMLKRPASSYTRSEILHMVMMAGLSTSKEVTQYSGRGVGMDVVNAVVRDFNGTVDIESEPGKGTSMTLFMPVSVTSVECLCFRIGPSIYHMPLFNLNKIYTAEEASEKISVFEESSLFDFDKRQIPILDMHALLDCTGEATFYVVCHSLDNEFVIGVDEILGDFSCANKQLPSCLDAKWQDACPIRNVAVMDDGTVGYVLNAAILADFAQGKKKIPEAENQHEDAGIQSLPFETGTLTEVPAWAFVFTLGDTWYALPVEQIERLNPMLTCSQTPRSLPYLVGLTNYRNHAIAVFDLAKSAGVEGDCPYVLIMEDQTGELVGVTITSAIGIRDMSDAVLCDEQPEPRALACGLHTATAVISDPKEPVITVLVRS